MAKIVILHLKTKCNTMDFNLKGHAAMFGANTMWGLMSPVSKIIMAQWKFSGDKHKSLQVDTERTFHQRYPLAML